MADITIKGNDRFPVGTTVSVYPAVNRMEGHSPVGSSVSFAVVAADSTLTFEGLADGAQYVAYALVGGEHRYIGFATSPALPPSGVPGDLGQPEVFVQQTTPSASYPYVWVVTDGAGNPTGEIRSNYGGARGAVDPDAIQALVDAKGELLAGSAADTLTRVPAGTSNGQVLTRNSAVAAGMDWQTASGLTLPYISGKYYTTPGAGNQSASAPTLNRLYFLPFIVYADSVAFDQIGISTGAAAGAGGVAKLAVYAPGTGAAAGALLASAQVATDTAAGDKPAAISLTLGRGFYWLSAAFQVSVTGLTVVRISYVTGPPVPADAMGTVGYTWKSGDTTSGALPDPGGSFTATPVGTFAGPAVFLRAA